MATAAAVQPTERPGRVKSFLKLVAIEHSVFALPFAYLSALAAMQVNGGQVRWLDLLLITVAILYVLRDAAGQVWRRLMDAVDPHMVETGERVLAETPGVRGVTRLRLRGRGCCSAWVCGPTRSVATVSAT